MSVTLTLTETQVPNGKNVEDTRLTSHEVENGHNVEEEEEEREAELIMFDNTTQGLGLKICGGCSTDGREVYGIFVKRVLPGGLAERTGEVSDGDLILEVNGQSMEGITYDRAISLLRQASASNHVEMVVTRDAEARTEYAEYLNKCGPIQSPALVLDHQYDGQIPDSELDFRRKMGSLLKDTSLDLNSSGNQNDLNLSGNLGDLNGHISPASSCASELANHISESSSSPRLPRPYPANGGKDTPSNYLDPMLSKKLAQDPDLRLHIDQLESAVVNLGLPLSAASQNTLREKLSVDNDGMVRFEEFVEASKTVFREDLRALKGRMTPKVAEDTASAQAGVAVEDYATVVRERDTLRAELAALKEEMKSRCQSSQSDKEQLLYIRKQAQTSIEEGRSLRSKLHLAEQAHARAQQTERDYEEVVAMLENEVAQLKLQLSKSDGVNMQKRLAVLVCQLKKAESGKKTYEVATDKLMRYVEHSVDVLTSVENSPRILPGVDSANSKANKKKALNTLSVEGREAIKTVRSLMETVPLPFGWEEAYTAEGVKYYINHLNQTTTWTHPVSCMEHQTSANKQPPAPPPTTTATTTTTAAMAASASPS
ncbi:syntaxin-binding protein 4, partial [Aplysia californica]|uniref:Syntaxin-binding protein 4 n=1 Tax=Aplysia californica TaxID=6500 RepID=A0ABM1ADI9_APLCA